MLSVAPERSIDPLAIEILKEVDRVMQELGLEYFVTGAAARDILLSGVFGLDTGRGTKDVDLAIAVDGWLQFDTVKRRLVETGVFDPDEGVIHRLFYVREPGRRSYPLDLIPFGPIEETAHEIAWPPDRSNVMNVAGYRDAFAAAPTVEIQPGFILRVLSLPGLAILKLFAWADRGAGDPRDAIDLVTLLRQYSGAGNEDRLFGAEIEILETLNYDLGLAGPRLLGRDAARITGPTTLNQILALLDDARRWDQLLGHMAREFRWAENPIAETEALMAQFKAGLRDI